MFNVRLAGGHLYGKQLFTWLSLVVSLMASFVLSFFPLDVLDEIWDLIESVSEGFLTYSFIKPSLLFFFNFFWVFLASKGSNYSESKLFIIHVNMLSLLPWVWERVYTPIVIFLDGLTFENAVLFSPRHYQQLAADTCMLPQRRSGSPITSPSFFSRSS